MIIFKVESNSVAYDEDESMIILTTSEERALEKAEKEWKFRQGRKHSDFSVTRIESCEEKIIHIAHYGD